MKEKLFNYKNSVSKQFNDALQSNVDEVTFGIELKIEHPYNLLFLQDAADEKCKTDRKYTYHVKPADSSTFGSKPSSKFNVHIMRRDRKREELTFGTSEGTFFRGIDRSSKKVCTNDVFSDAD